MTKIEIQPIDTDSSGEHGSVWQPTIGSKSRGFIRDVAPPSAEEALRSTAVSILSQCLPPGEESAQETGLVVGYVQSGKTLSFESVMALANDNGYQLIILLAGTKNNLLEQSTRRVSNDLGLNSDSANGWILLTNPEVGTSDIGTIENAVAFWRDVDAPSKLKRTIIITVLKNHRRIDKLTRVLREVNLSGMTALIIDDEGDQASLNNEVNEDEQSTTYTRLTELREALPRHTFLQYTATPQAPLLVSIADQLSPNFVSVLTPGEAYTGGLSFFVDRTDLVQEIPYGELPSDQLITSPPSLLNALAVFMVGVAIALVEPEDGGSLTLPRSMLVHPSHLTDVHSEYANWIRDTLAAWRACISEEASADRDGLLTQFEVAYDELRSTSGRTIPPFEDLVPSLSYALNSAHIEEVNSANGSTPRIEWSNHLAWILVGGASLDRGFTVEGLTVTYMPRGTGVGNADTIQQRARFFGYKRDFLGLCRVYLEPEALEAFQNYVRHEEDVMRQLREIERTGQPLDDWKRAFILDADLNPCRASVLENGYVRARPGGWNIPRRILHSEDGIASNRETVSSFLEDVAFTTADGHADRTPIQTHSLALGIQLNEVLENLVIPYRVAPGTDSDRFLAMTLALASISNADAHANCDVYLMSGGNHRARTADNSGQITNLFQGANPNRAVPADQLVYPGDGELKSDDRPTIQIHILDISRPDGSVLENVPVVAVNLPQHLVDQYLIQ